MCIRFAWQAGRLVPLAPSQGSKHRLHPTDPTTRRSQSLDPTEFASARRVRRVEFWFSGDLPCEWIAQNLDGPLFL